MMPWFSAIGVRALIRESKTKVNRIVNPVFSFVFIETDRTEVMKTPATNTKYSIGLEPNQIE
jgi:hypothetical protein